MRKMMVLLIGILVVNTPVSAQIKSEVVKHGENGQVSTIIGNGNPSQGTYTVEGPRNIAVSGKNIYFVDGPHDKAKLRMFNGKKNITLIDLPKDEVAAKNSNYFVSTGLAVVDRNIFISSHVKLYMVKTKANGKMYLTHLSKVRDYMEDNGYDYIFRMEQYKEDLYLMLSHKGTGYPTYGLIKYTPKSKSIKEVLQPDVYGIGVNNFYVDKDGILVSTQEGVLQSERFFPRKSIDVIDTNTGSFIDAWSGKDDYIYFVMHEDRVKWIIYKRHRDDVEDRDLVAGGRLGYVDGLVDQVEMDGATDFVWDGSGYIFADKGNHAIRKLWLDSAPTSAV